VAQDEVEIVLTFCAGQGAREYRTFVGTEVPVGHR
jgi:hypothetical protein